MPTPTSTFRFSDLTRRQIAALVAATGHTQTAVVSTAIDRMYREETKTMNTITISSGTYELEQLAKLVAAASNRGKWYCGEGSTNVEDWLAEGDIDTDATIESLAAEWDS